MSDDKAGPNNSADEFDPDDFDDEFDEDFDTEVDEDLVAFEKQLEADAKFDETHDSEGEDGEVAEPFVDEEDF